MNYFSSFNDLQELKAQYKKLAFQFHPDKGGSKEDFQAMSNEYEKLLHDALKGLFNSSEHIEKELEIDEHMREALNRIITLPLISIEIVGNWLWVTGSTFPVKEQLNEAKFKFSGKKKAWYWHDGEFKKRSRKNLSLDDIRKKYGCEKVDKEEVVEIN